MVTAASSIDIREIKKIPELRNVEDGQKEVWGCDDREIFPSLALIPMLGIGGVNSLVLLKLVNSLITSGADCEARNELVPIFFVEYLFSWGMRQSSSPISYSLRFGGVFS